MPCEQTLDIAFDLLIRLVNTPDSLISAKVIALLRQTIGDEVDDPASEVVLSEDKIARRGGGDKFWVATNLIFSGNEKLKQAAIEFCAQLTGLETDKIEVFLSFWKRSSNHYLSEKAKETRLSSSHLWRCSDIAKATMNNLAMITKLELIEKGCVEVLYRKFGIVDFARYPIELLLTQYRERDEDRPWVSVINGYWDHNGSLYNSDEHYDSIFGELKKMGVKLVVFEAGQQGQIARNLRFYQKDKKQNLYALSCIIGSHGNENVIVLDDRDIPGSRISLRDIVNSRFISYGKKFFANDATFIFKSCSTAAMGAIGQKWSRESESCVIGPTCPTTIQTIQVSGSAKQLYWEVEYHKKQDEASTTAQYKKGVKIS